MRTSLTSLIIYLLILLLGGYGWIMNIVTLTKMEGVTGMLVVRAIGILLAPLGAIMGYV